MDKKQKRILGIIIAVIFLITIPYLMSRQTDYERERFEKTEPLTPEGAEQKEVIQNMSSEEYSGLTIDEKRYG